MRKKFFSCIYKFVKNQREQILHEHESPDQSLMRSLNSFIEFAPLILLGKVFQVNAPLKSSELVPNDFVLVFVSSNS